MLNKYVCCWKGWWQSASVAKCARSSAIEKTHKYVRCYVWS